MGIDNWNARHEMDIIGVCKQLELREAASAGDYRGV